MATTSLVIRREQKTSTGVPAPKHLYDLLPKSVQPYVRRSRLDKSIGSWLLFLPGAWSIAMAGISMNNSELIGLFGLGTILMRGAGCTINDLWDRDFDRRVERTRSRPIVSGEVTVRQALLWAGAQLSLSFLI